MSSFTISKEDYIKAAGLVAGIKTIHSDIWLYDQKAGKQMEDIELYSNFVDCFTMNALSVAEQYHESPWTDSNEYRDTFKAYKEKGKQYALHPEKLKMLIMELRHFFHSALYQTENESYSMLMGLLFDKIIDALMPYLYRYECNSWGDIDLSNIEEMEATVYTPLF